MALSFEGEVISMFLTKGGLEDFIREVQRAGTPSIIACDVAKAPFFAKKLSAIYHVPLFSPPQDLSEREKERISPLKDRHLRDAHAAAVVCWRKYANRIRHVLATEKNKEKAEFLIHCLLNGMTVSEGEREFLARQESVKKSAGERPKKTKSKEVRANLREFLDEITRLRKRIRELEEENRALRSAIERLKKEKKEVLKDREIKKLRNKILALTRELERLRQGF